MSAKKGRRAKVLKVPQHESQKGSSFEQRDSPNLSAIERASFLEGLQQNYGNPLHSTALEEDLNILEEVGMKRGKAEKKDVPQRSKTTVKQHEAAKKRKKTERDGEDEEEQINRDKEEKKEITVKQRGATAKMKKTVKDGENDEEERMKKKSRQSTAPWDNNQQIKGGKKRKTGPGSGLPSDPESQENSDPGTAQGSRRTVLSSEEEQEDEDKSWGPSPKKAKVYSLGGRTRKSLSDKSKSRKSSSGSASADDKHRRKKLAHQGATELEVVLDAFLDFCDQYRESVESNTVKQSIDSFSSSVKEQVLEKINCSKELKALKRENAKVGSLIRTKTQKLLDAKHELMRAERQVWFLEKEKAELKARSADLKQGLAFLHDIRELSEQYLDYRRKHPKGKETYGASSLPALLLEIKHIQAADLQQRGIDKQLKNGVKNNETQK